MADKDRVVADLLSECAMNNRRNDRHKLGVNATIRDANRARIGGHIVDISEWGCKVELFTGRARLGQLITIKLDGMESLSGCVKWIEHTTIGIELQRPLHPAVVDHLARTRAQVDLT